jgi:hypothetical protein
MAALSAVALIIGCNQEDPTSVSESVGPNAGRTGNEAWIITTYYWENGDWVEHAWWDASFLKPDVRISFFASNWSDWYPGFAASFDNVHAYGNIDLDEGLIDDFEDGDIGDVWGGGDTCVGWGQGAQACEVGGEITVVIDQGTYNGEARVAGLASWDFVHYGEFDVQVDFTLSPGFHALPEEAFVTLAVLDDRDFNASMQLSTGSYQSIERGGWDGYYKPIRITPTTDLNGKLRITRTRVRNASQVVESVTGSGSRPAVEQEGDWRTFAFAAHRYGDGTIRGQWERIRRQDGNADDSKSHGVVTCFTVVGNEAWLGGYATSGVYSDPPRNRVGWRVKDNSQGNTADPDEISLQWTQLGPNGPWWHCAETLDDPDHPNFLPLNDIEAGDIRVRP